MQEEETKVVQNVYILVLEPVDHLTQEAQDGGGVDVNSGYAYDTFWGQDGVTNGGKGGDARTHRDSGEWAQRIAGGGAGNPGGNGKKTKGNNTKEGSNYADSNGSNGTGGLLIIYSNILVNNSSIEACGRSGGHDNNVYGGGSGGGSINIFYRDELQKQGNISASGGYNGGSGSISIGNISTETYESIYTNY